jgi:NAD(P)-dependent dehydrogenase (short-subunit alcohol dehydrogenase family)
MRDLHGKLALVTGARTGLGAASALALAQRGAEVIVSGRKSGDCDHVVHRIRNAGGTAHDFAIDVADISAIPSAMATLTNEFGRLAVLVNNAATIAPMALLRDLDAIAFDAALRLNVSGPAALVSALWPHLSGGRVINIVSGAANRALPGWAAYCASKAALLMLTHSMALEGAASGLKAFAFAPGLVDTAMQAEIRAARINAISDVLQDTLLPPSTPAAVIAWLAAGYGDDLTDTFIDIRQPGLLDRVALSG